jgi:hypothetical protein
MQKIYVPMATVATIGHYGIYVALPQGPVDGPGIADVPQERKDIALHMSLNEGVSDKNICCYTGISERAMKHLCKTFHDTFESRNFN